jgi:hypothetical protein
VGVVVKHQQLARQVGEFIDYPSENSMASFNFTSAVLDEGTTFIFGSWICVANSLGGFNSQLANSKELEASSSTASSDHDEFINNLDDLLFPDLAQQIEKMSIFNATSTRDAPNLFGSDSNQSEKTTRFNPSPIWRRIWICCSKSRTWAPPLAEVPRFQHPLELQ